MTRARLLTLALVLLSAWTLASRVYTSFDGVRIKVVRDPQTFTGSDLDLLMPDSPGWAKMATPVVVIAKLQNPGDVPALVAATLNGEHLEFTLPRRGEHRLDLVVRSGEPIRAEDRLTFHVRNQGAVADGCCVLQYLEVANLHGGSNAIPSFIIVPRGSRVYESPGWIAVACSIPILAWLLLRGDGLRLSRRVQLIRHGVTIVVVLLFVIALVSPLFRPMVVLSLESFVLGAIGLTWPGLVRTWRELRPPAVLRAAVAATVVGLFYGLLAQTYVTSTSMNGNYSGFLRIGRQFADRVPYLTERPALKSQLLILDDVGYDGQFFYYIAFDPFLLAFRDQPARYEQIVDAPPYRFGRIGFSLLTKLASLNDPAQFPRTMIALIVVGSFAGAWCLAMMAMRAGRAAWWALLWMLVPGFIQSLRTALPEAIAAALLVAGYWAFLRRRYGLTALLLAASLLVRETGLVFVVMLAGWTGWRDRQWRGSAILVSAMVPLLAWRAYVAWRLFDVFGWRGFFFNPENLGVPFAGILDMWQRIHAGTYSTLTEMTLAGTYFPLLLAFALIVALVLAWTRPGALTCAALAYALVAVSLNYAAIWAHVGNGERGTFEVFLLLIVAFVTIDRLPSRMRFLLPALFVGMLVYIWIASIEASLVRYVVLSSLS